MATQTEKKGISYLRLDETRYIKDGEFKIRLNEYDTQEYCTWDEMWDMVLSDIDKLEEYELNINNGKRR